MKKFDAVKVVRGERAGENGVLVTFVETDTSRVVAVEFEDGKVNTYDPESIQPLSASTN